MPKYDPETARRVLPARPQRWGRSLIYFHTLAECQRGADALLQGRACAAEVVTGSSDRDRQLDDFAAGELDVLSNCMVLSEGFDCPQLQTVFCRPSCKSVTIQMAGRVLRKHPDVPFKQIVQCQADALAVRAHGGAGRCSTSGRRRVAVAGGQPAHHAGEPADAASAGAERRAAAGVREPAQRLAGREAEVGGTARGVKKAMGHG